MAKKHWKPVISLAWMFTEQRLRCDWQGSQLSLFIVFVNWDFVRNPVHFFVKKIYLLTDLFAKRVVLRPRFVCTRKDLTTYKLSFRPGIFFISFYICTYCIKMKIFQNFTSSEGHLIWHICMFCFLWCTCNSEINARLLSYKCAQPFSALSILFHFPSAWAPHYLCLPFYRITLYASAHGLFPAFYRSSHPPKCSPPSASHPQDPPCLPQPWLPWSATSMMSTWRTRPRSWRLWMHTSPTCCWRGSSSLCTAVWWAPFPSTPSSLASSALWDVLCWEVSPGLFGETNGGGMSERWWVQGHGYWGRWWGSVEVG